MPAKKSRAYQNRQKALILQALTDAKFRKLLQENPKKALGTAKLTAEMKKEVQLVLAAVKGINSQISALADELLCANGGGCGIAAG
ncbi:hypothetical protein [Prosthecochloris sp.]|uniref:hypothetical protein n=1 Tax=Prosthecochloris sp. TaxID=290513 RepID=UPI00257CD3F4|nr:hypothetical protein [Prosthecochloris sp.]